MNLYELFAPNVSFSFQVAQDIDIHCRKSHINAAQVTNALCRIRSAEETVHAVILIMSSIIREMCFFGVTFLNNHKYDSKLH